MKPVTILPNIEIKMAAQGRRKKILLAMYAITIFVLLARNVADVYHGYYGIVGIQTGMLILVMAAFVRLYQRGEYEKASYAILVLLAFITAGAVVLEKFDNFTPAFLFPYVLAAFSLFSWKKGLLFSAIPLGGLVCAVWIFPEYFSQSHFLQNTPSLFNALFIALLVVVFGFYYEVTRIDATRRLIEVGHKKDLLYNEIHHRVKNNLNIVSSLLAIQAEQESLAVQNIIKASKDRIDAMALVHSMLYVSSDIEKVNAKLFLEKLSSTIGRTTALHVKVQLEVEPLELTLNEVMPLGLITNELLTNSFKYAFAGVLHPCITLALFTEGENVVFFYQDNGVGAQEEKVGVGLRLVQLNVRQLKGTLTLERGAGLGYKIVYKRRVHV